MPIQKKTVAIIDDDPAIRSTMRDLLSAFGYVTYTFDSAEAFLNVAGASKADCLLVDIQLGDISGLELARQLEAEGFEFPTIFMTGFDNETIRHEARTLGCVAYLRKPFTSDQLVEAIVRATS